MDWFQALIESIKFSLIIICNAGLWVLLFILCEFIVKAFKKKRSPAQTGEQTVQHDMYDGPDMEM